VLDRNTIDNVYTLSAKIKKSMVFKIKKNWTIILPIAEEEYKV